MKYTKAIIAPGPKLLPDERDILAGGVANANKEFEMQGKQDSLMFLGFDSDGYATLILGHEDELDLSTFFIEAMIPAENHVNYKELTFAETKTMINRSQMSFRYFSRSSAIRILGDGYVIVDSGHDYDYINMNI